MKIRFIHLVLLAFLICASLKAQSPTTLLGPRNFTDEHGRSLSARIIAIDEQSITVRRSPDNTEFTLQIEKLSLLDQAWLEHHAAALRVALSPLPDTDFVRAIREDFAIPSLSGLRTIEADFFAQTKRFVIFYNDSIASNSSASWIGKMINRAAADDVAWLWLGPIGAYHPAGIDITTSRGLPENVLVVRRRAVLAAIKETDEALLKIAEVASPGNPNAFISTLHRQPPEYLDALEARIGYALPAYWVKATMASKLPKHIGTKTSVFVVDREGKQTDTKGLEPVVQEWSVNSPVKRVGPDTVSVSSPSIVANTADATSEKAVHEFTASDGRRLTARILSIGADSVQVLRETDRKIFVFTRPELSAADWAFVQNLRQDPRYLPPPPADILPPRKNAETERSRAARFAVDLFLASNHGEMRRWDDRPTLVMENEFPEIADSVRWYYNDYCSAVGFTGSPDPTLEIVFVTGSAKHLSAKQKELGWSPRDIAGWQWQFYPFHEKRLRRMVVLVRIDKPLGADQQRRLFRCMAIGFGAMGKGGDWSGAELSDSGKAITLSELDRHFLRTIYRHVPSGTSRDKFPALVSKHWVNPNAEPDPVEESTR